MKIINTDYGYTLEVRRRDALYVLQVRHNGLDLVDEAARTTPQAIADYIESNWPPGTIATWLI